ncbi:hypothetical protein ACET3Z_023013 [Daucus carota]
MKFTSSKFSRLLFVTFFLAILAVNAEQIKSNDMNAPNKERQIGIKCSLNGGDCCFWFFKCLKCCDIDGISKEEEVQGLIGRRGGWVSSHGPETRT